MAFPTLNDIKKEWYWALLDLFFFLTVLTLIGSGLAVSVLLIPAISASLAFAFLPQVMVSIIALLPLIVCAAFLLQLIEHQWFIITVDRREYFSVIKDKSMTEGKLRIIEYLRMHLFVGLIWVLRNFVGIAKDYFVVDKDDKSIESLSILFYLLVALTAIGLGIYLSVMILPSLVPAIVALTGVSSVVAGLFGALAAVVSMMLTYHFLMLPLRLFALGLRFKLWQREERYKDLLFHAFQSLVMLTGIALAAYTSYLIFPLIVDSLLPFLPHATAVFTAIAISVSLVTLMMTTLPPLIDFLGSGLRMAADKGGDKPSALTYSFKRWEGGLRVWLSGLKNNQHLNIQSELQQDYPEADSFVLPVVDEDGEYDARALDEEDGVGLPPYALSRDGCCW